MSGLERSNVPRFVNRRPTVLPLPIGWGEGRGEGKPDGQTLPPLQELTCTKMKTYSGIRRAGLPRRTIAVPRKRAGPLRPLLAATALSCCIGGAVAGVAPAFTEIDLSGHLSCAWDGYKPWATWNGPPGGRQVLRGVPFRIEGVIQLKTSESHTSEFYLTRADAIPVGRRITQLHLLHFSEMVAPHGAPAARLILHYADGQARVFVLRYGVHFQDWSHPAYGNEAADPNSHYAWMAPQLDKPDDPFVTTFWETVLPNPRPEVEVISFDLRSLFSKCRYNLAAATAESGPDRIAEGPLLDPRPIPAVIEPVVQRVRLLDAADGSPIGHAEVQAWLREGDNWSKWVANVTDKQGEVSFDFQPGSGEIPVQLRALSPRHLAGRFSLVAKPQNGSDSQLPEPKAVGATNTAPPPETPAFRLARGGTIGGVVQDEQGRPVANAAVVAAGVEKDMVGKFTLAQWPTARTGADGRWVLSCAPSNFTGLTLTFQHPDFLPATYEQEDAGGAGPLTVRADDLSRQKAVFRLHAGEELKGRVTAAGAPVLDAQVTLFLGETPAEGRRTARTDRDGHFALRGLEAGPARLLVTAEGFAPKLQKLGAKTNALTVALSRAKPLQAVVRDPSGQPVPHVLFELTPGGEQPWLRHIAYTDVQGKFLWDSSPADSATFLVACNGFRPLKDVTLNPGSAPRELTLLPTSLGMQNSSPEQRRRRLTPMAARFALAKAAPDRDAIPLSLDSFYNQVTLKSWVAVPKGLQRLDGIPFQINGYIELASSRTLTEGGALPLEAAGIPVGKKFSRLHLLHCAEYYDGTGRPLEQLVLYYANGERRVARLVYGVHAQDWYDAPGDYRGLVRDPNSKVAWKGPSEDAAQYGKVLRLYHTPLDNPLPDQVVTRLDIISELCAANPMILAVSLEDNPTAPSRDSLFEPESPSHFDAFSVRAVDAASLQPIAGARVRVTAKCGPAPVLIADSPSDPQGRLELLCPHGRFDSFAVTVTANGRQASSTTVTGAQTEPLPNAVTVKLSRGAEIGGRVLDTADHPIAGVAIHVRGIVKDANGQFSLTDLDSVTTDAKGQWTSSAGGADFKTLMFSLSCAGFADTEYELQAWENGTPLVVSRADLQAKSSIMRMERAQTPDAGKGPAK